MNMEIDGAVIAYEIIGEGQPVIVLHGLELDRTSMKAFLEPVFQEASSYQRIYIDLPGMGCSSAGERLKSTDDMLRAVLTLISNVIPDKPFLVAGLSYGGYLARGLAERLPGRVDGMLLICPVILPYARDRQVERHIVAEQDKAFVEQLEEAERDVFLRDMVIQTPAIHERYKTEIAEAVAISDKAFVQGDFFTKHYGLSIDPDRKAEQFQKPVTIITGRQDAVTGYKDAMALSLRYPHATFAALDAAGHFVQIEQADFTAAMTKEWLGRCKKAAANDQ